MWGKYCKRLPISYFSPGMGLWPLLEAGTGLGRPFEPKRPLIHPHVNHSAWVEGNHVRPLHKSSSLLMLVLER